MSTPQWFSAQQLLLGIKKSAPHCIVLALCAGMIRMSAQERYGSMPNGWANEAITFSDQQTKDPSGNSALESMRGIVAHQAHPNGGPQPFECYTYDDHSIGSTRLTFGCISNVELAGAGTTEEVRSWGGGGVVSGPAHVNRWTMYGAVVAVTDRNAVIEEACALCPKWIGAGQIQTIKGVWLDDPRTSNYLAGVTTVDTLKFSNGWLLRSKGDDPEYQRILSAVRAHWERDRRLFVS